MVRKNILCAFGAAFVGLDRFKESCCERYWKSRLKSCGKNCRIAHPIKIPFPECVSIGDDVTLFDGIILNTMKEYPWNKEQKFDSELVIDDGASIFRFCRITVTHRMRIGKDVMIADRCYIADSTHDYTKIETSIERTPLMTFSSGIEIADEAWIGTHCVIVGNIRIGKHSVIGANSVVRQNIPDYSVAVGAPARIIKRFDPKSGLWRPTNTVGDIIA